MQSIWSLGSFTYTRAPYSLSLLLFTFITSLFIFVAISSIRWKTYEFPKFLEYFQLCYISKIPKLSKVQTNEVIRALTNPLGRDKALKIVSYSMIFYASGSNRYKQLVVCFL